jgi:hypothetical protein
MVFLMLNLKDNALTEYPLGNSWDFLNMFQIVQLSGHSEKELLTMVKRRKYGMRCIESLILSD